jgi:hypothetical protein
VIRVEARLDETFFGSARTRCRDRLGALADVDRRIGAGVPLTITG